MFKRIWSAVFGPKGYKPSRELRAATIPSLRLDVDGKSYIVEFPLSAVAGAELKLGHGLTSFSQWLDIKPGEIPTILEAGLQKHHPDVTAAEVQAICDGINPESLDEVHFALCHLAFPRAMQRFEELRAKAIANGGTLPNVPGGAPESL